MGGVGALAVDPDEYVAAAAAFARVRGDSRQVVSTLAGALDGSSGMGGSDLAKASTKTLRFRLLTAPTTQDPRPHRGTGAHQSTSGTAPRPKPPPAPITTPRPDDHQTADPGE